MIRKIPTRRSTISRLLDHWVVIAMVYAVPAVLFIALNFPSL